MARGKLCLVLACLAVAASSASAFVFKAGGTGEWRVPNSGAGGGGNTSEYNRWAERNRFRVGDAVAFTYQPGNDSVLLVDKSAYDACDLGSPIDRFADGNTVFTFTRSGPYYFISGNRDNCNRDQKLVVVVMAERADVNNNGTALAPSPAGAGSGTTSPFSPPSPPPPPGFEISPTTNGQPANPAAPRASGIAVAGKAALAVVAALSYALA